jgi:hypothetical protein
MRQLLLLACVVGCSHKGYVVVHVQSNVPLLGVARLHGTVTHDKVARDFDLDHAPAVDIPPEQTFAIEVPPDVTGLLQLHLQAVGGSGAILAEADAEGLIEDGKLTIVFGGSAGNDLGPRNDLRRPLDAGVADLAGADFAGVDLAATVPCPNVMFVVDHTGSTIDAVDGGSKLSAEVEAVNTVAAEFDSRVPIGLVTFANLTGVCTDGVVAGPEPMIGNGSLIAAQLQALVSNGAGNNDVAMQHIQGDGVFLSRNPSYVIMITDNAPNCAGGGLTPSDPTTTTACANSVSMLSGNGYPVWVVGIGAVADPPALDSIAQGGGRICSGGTCIGHKYWPVSDVGGLTELLRTILNQVANNCSG